jgi:hypothetical protein
MADPLYYVVSVKHTQREQPYITVWRPENAGYAWPLSWAGRYPQSEIAASLDYYHGGDSVAIPCRLLDDMAVPTPPGTVDNDAGPVVLNSKANWALIMGWLATMEPRPLCMPKPQYKGARRRKETP